MNVKILGAVVIATLYAVTPMSAQDSDSAELSLDSEKAKTSYSLGAMYGDFLKGGADLVDLDIVMQAIVDAIEGNEPPLEQQEMAQLFGALQQKLTALRQAELAKKGEAALEVGTAFLAENGKKEGVTTTASGLQYKVITQGSGASPTATDTVVVQYEGTLVDGTVFDSSYKRGEPASFPVNRVIAGWTEALQLMKPGDRWELYIPQDLAYRDRGSPPVIPPYAALIFTVELLEVKTAGLTIR